jgi:hypothetical protein
MPKDMLSAVEVSPHPGPHQQHNRSQERRVVAHAKIRLVPTIPKSLLAKVLRSVLDLVVVDPSVA